jgi:thymidine kinase
MDIIVAQPMASTIDSKTLNDKHDTKLVIDRNDNMLNKNNVTNIVSDRNDRAASHASAYGKITMYCGPMFAQKTTYLLRDVGLARIKSKIIGVNILLVGNKNDTRYYEDLKTMNAIISHSKIVDKDCVQSHKLSEIDVKGISHIFVDEGQLFDDLASGVLSWVRQGINVTIACLDAYSSQKLWPQVAELLPYVNLLHKLSSICVVCGEDTPLTINKNGNKNSQTLIGHDDLYTTLCLQCLDATNLKNN